MSAAYLARYSKFQFTRPRGARHLREIHKILKEVSIHAPARGATSSGPRRQARELVSIHAPARGATRRPLLLSIPAVGFNSRAREGRDSP